jgi:hypothetical protein
VSATILLAILFAFLLGLEWRYRSGSIRVAAASLALVVLFFAQPIATRAARRALVMSPAERVTRVGGDQLSEYASGGRTMEQAVADDVDLDADARLLSLGILFWLACSPVLRRARRPSQARPDALPGEAEAAGEETHDDRRGAAFRRAAIEPDDVRTRDDFVALVRSLIANVEDAPEEWENVTLPAYLEALAAWVEDRDGYYQNRGEPVPDVSWKAVADILLAAKVYE